MPDESPTWLLDHVPEWAVGATTTAAGVYALSRTELARQVGGALVDGAKWTALQLRSYETRKKADEVAAYRALSIGLAAIRREANANRVSCILLHNGGGDVFASTNPKYLTVVDVAEESVKVDARVRWGKELMTDAYRHDVLEPLLAGPGDTHDLITTDLDPDNPLRDYYTADAITFAVVASAGVSSKGLWFTSVQYKDVSQIGRDALLHVYRAREYARASAALVRRLKERLP